MKYLFLALSLLLATGVSAQPSKSAFKRTSFDRVIITEVDYPNPEMELRPGWEPGRALSAAFVAAPNDSNHATLTPAEADTLYRKLVSPKSYRYGASICFVPRLHLYFLKGDTLVNHVAVCIECNRLKSDVKIAPAEWPKDSLNPKGMSVGMRLFLDRLIRRYGFEHGVDGSSVWDKP